MSKYLLLVFVACSLSVVLAQDMDPQPLEDDTTTSTTTTTETPSTSTPSVTTTTEQLASSTAAIIETTELHTTSSPVTDSPFTTTTERPEMSTTSTTTASTSITEQTTILPNPWRPLPSHPWRPLPSRPWYPGYEETFAHQQCYYKQQRSESHWKWFCGQLKLVWSLSCYRCCLYIYSNLGTCYEVHNHHCNNYK